MIADGDYIILKKDAYMRGLLAQKNGRPIVMDKLKFRLDEIFGRPYGTSFEFNPKLGQLVPHDFSIHEVVPEAASGADNRNLVGKNEENQTLTKEDIMSLKKGGVSSMEVMSELVKNSATFMQKTKFSQEKWLKKKKSRHMNLFTVLKPCTRLIAEMYFHRDPNKIGFVRIDSLAQILTYSNVQATSKVLMVETCQGLLVGAVLERLSDGGKLVQLFTGPNPMKGRPAFDDFGFPKALTRSRMMLYPLNHLANLGSLSQQKLASCENGPIECTQDSQNTVGDSLLTGKRSLLNADITSPAKRLRLDHDACKQSSSADADSVSDLGCTPQVEDIQHCRTHQLGVNSEQTAIDTVERERTSIAWTADKDTPSHNDKDTTTHGDRDTPSHDDKDTTTHDSLSSQDLSNTASDLLLKQVVSHNNKVIPLHDSMTIMGLQAKETLITAESPDIVEPTFDSPAVSPKGSNGGETNLKTARGEPQHVKDRNTAKEYIENNLFDALIIAVKYHPSPLVLRLIERLRMSRSFVVYHQHKEALMDCFVRLKERGGVVNLRLTETWLREIQVLPERTHPVVNMSGTGGYLLTGTIVES